MSQQRRLVRVAPSFLERLDELLPPERSAAGVASATDFLLHDLPPMIDRLAERYEDVTTIVPEAPGVRVHLTAGVLVGHLAIYATQAADGAIDIIYLDVDRPAR